MKPCLKRIFALLLAFCLSLCTSVTVFAAGGDNSITYGESNGRLGLSKIDSERLCETTEELVAELEKDIGGIIRVDDKAYIVFEELTEITVTKPVTIYLPEYGIDILESLTISGPITFEGNWCFTVGSYANLYLHNGVQVHSTGRYTAVYMSEGSRLEADSSVTLYAEGEDAITIFCEEESFLNLGYATVKASGANSTTIYGMGGNNVSQAFVQAEGTDSLGVYSYGDIYLLNVSVEGAVCTETVYSSFSKFSETPENLVELETEIYNPVRRFTVYQGLVGKSEAVIFPNQITYTYYYEHPEYFFEFPIGVDCTMNWDLGGLDYSIPGTYTVVGTPQPIIEVPELPIPLNEYEITVVPQNRVAISHSLGEGHYVLVDLLSPILDAEEVLLWVHEGDAGWRELTFTNNAVYAEEWNDMFHENLSHMDIEYPFFYIIGLEEDEYYWIVAQVIGGSMDGFSNLLSIYTDTQKGGDRTGTDRFGAKPDSLPPSKITEEEELGENIPQTPESEKPPAGIDKPNLPNADNYDTNSRDQSAKADQRGIAIAQIENNVLPPNSDIEYPATLFVHATAQDVGYKTVLEVKVVDMSTLPNATKDYLEKMPVNPSNTPNAVGSQKEGLSPKIEQEEGAVVEKTVIVLLFVAALLIISLAFLKLYRKRRA